MAQPRDGREVSPGVAHRIAGPGFALEPLAGGDSDSEGSFGKRLSMESSLPGPAEFSADDAEERDGIPTPGVYIRFLSRRPCTVIAGVLGVQALFLLVFLVTLMTGALKVEFGNAPLTEDREHVSWRRSAALAEAGGSLSQLCVQTWS